MFKQCFVKSKKPYRVLVSFCNLPKVKTAPLACIEFTSTSNPIGRIRSVNLGPKLKSNHVTGLTRDEHNIFVAYYFDESSYLAVLDGKTLTFKWQQKLEDSRDVHSIIRFQDSLLVVSTGTNQVFKYKISKNSLSKPTVYWQANIIGKDTEHLNSIAVDRGKVYISSFGVRRDATWSSSANNGTIRSIPDGQILVEGLDHPHTVTFEKHKAYYCESMKGTFNSIDNVIVRTSGYTRGITWLTKDLVVFATSVGRTKSRSQGTILNPSDPGTKTGNCALHVVDIRTETVTAVIDLSTYSSEIYDLLNVTNFDCENF
jgi:hypothetical protein